MPRVNAKTNITKTEESMARHILAQSDGCPFKAGCPDEDEARCLKCITVNASMLSGNGDGTESPEPQPELLHAFTAGTFDPESGTAGFAAFLTDADGVELMHTEGSFDTAKEITGYNAELVAFQSLDALLALYDDSTGYCVKVHPVDELLRHNFFYLWHEDKDMAKKEDRDGNRYLDYFGNGNWFCADDDEDSFSAQLIAKCAVRARTALTKTKRRMEKGRKEIESIKGEDGNEE